MNKGKLILFLGSLLLIFLLFKLPRVVVENETIGVLPAQPSFHNTEKTPTTLLKIKEWNEKIISEKDIKKALIFADSLVNLYLKYNNIDSAMVVLSLMESREDEERIKKSMAALWYRTFESTTERKQAQIVAQETKKRLEALLTYNPENDSIRNMIAMTLMVSDNPMQGVEMLRGVLERNPENKQALKNLALLSIQSGQFDKAVERLNKLTQLDSTDQEVWYYLGVSLHEMGNQEGRKILEKILQTSQNPAIREMTTKYLENN